MSRWTDEDRTPLALVRADAGFSMEKAAVEVGIASRTLARYEYGISDITMRIAEKLAEIYNVPFEKIRKAVKDTWLMRSQKLSTQGN